MSVVEDDLSLPPDVEDRRPAPLRFATIGSVDDGKSTLIGRLLHDSKSIFEDQLAHIEAVSRRRGDRVRRPRPADRRPARRARAGDHDRRRLPLLLDAAPRLRDRRLPGARAVHPQHGHRRVDGRARHRAGRRPPRRRRSDAAPQPARCRCSACRTWWWRSTRWISSATARNASTRSWPRSTRLRRPPRRRHDHVRADLGARPAPTSSSGRASSLVPRPDAAAPPRDGLHAPATTTTIDVRVPRAVRRAPAPRRAP